MSLVANEQKKLLANALDRASTACLTVGIFTPLAGYLYDVGGLRDALDRWAGLSFIPWIVAAGILHYLARRTLKGLKQ